MSNPKVLITGAAGKVGNMLVKHIADRYVLVLGDTEPIQAVSPAVFMKVDAKLEEVRQACAGVDTVVHLAAEAHPDGAWENWLPNNIIRAKISSKLPLRQDVDG